MKNLSILLILVIAGLILNPGCKKKSDDNNPDDTLSPFVLTSDYTGTLSLLFNNTFPEFEETASVTVEVDKEGKMTFGYGSLNYFGENDDGQVKIKREGLLIISPNGEYFMNGDKVYFAVDENTDMIEEFTVWIWTGSNWQKTVEETVTDTWNNGLSFSLEDAEISGSVVEVSNENGTARWTLILVPKIVQ